MLFARYLSFISDFCCGPSATEMLWVLCNSVQVHTVKSCYTGAMNLQDACGKTNMSCVGAVQDTPSVYLCAVVPRAVSRRDLRTHVVSRNNPNNVPCLGTCTIATSTHE